MKSLLTVSLLLLVSSISFAQPKDGKTFVTPLAATVRLRDVPDKYNAQVVSLESEEPDAVAEQAEFRALKADVERRFPHKRSVQNNAQARTAAVPQPVIIRGFVPDSVTQIPPDNYMAVSNGTYGINVMNSLITVVDVTSGQILLRKSLYTFTNSLGLGTSPIGAYARYDPKVMYDPETDRFFFVTLAGVNENNWIIVGFSQSADPTGDWNLYKFYGDRDADSTWFDYPTIAITHDEVFLTGNKLVYNGSFQAGFRRSVIYEMRKRDGYDGQPLTMKVWNNVNYGGAPVRNIFPVKGGASLKGPAQHFLSVRNMSPQNDSVFLLKIGDTLNSPGNTLTVQAMKSNRTYGFPPNGRQKGITDKLQTNDARVLGAYLEGNEIQFVSTTVDTATGADAIYHGIISNYASAPSVQASYISVDTMDFAYPNISFAGNNGGLNASIISFDYSGVNHYPGVAAVLWDGSGHSPLLEIKQGVAPIKMLLDSIQRWGDYTGSQPRWNALGYVWTVGQFGKTGKQYNNWMSLLRSPYAVSVQNPTPTSSAATLFPIPSFQFIRLRFRLGEEANLRFAIYDMKGALIDQVLEAHCERGENEFQFNTASLPTGQYLLRGISGDGEMMINKTFTKQ